MKSMLPVLFCLLDAELMEYWSLGNLMLQQYYYNHRLTSLTPPPLVREQTPPI